MEDLFPRRLWVKVWRPKSDLWDWKPLCVVESPEQWELLDRLMAGCELKEEIIRKVKVTA